MEYKIIEMAALGRALYPGMLYDCRCDSFIPGVTLWDKKALRNDLDVHDKTKTFVKISASDNFKEKANLLDVSASLKASFLGGLVEVGGSAKYLNDTKSSTRQSRVTMQFSQTTKFEQLTMKELGNIAYPQVFDQKTATHVITAVLYGASAFMVFDYTSSESENKQAVEGNLHAVIKKIPSLSIEGQASLTMAQSEKNLTENINVTFYGDYELDENPTTYSDALKACKKLPSLLKERNSKGVPITVWLYPLTLLDDRAAKFLRDISLTLVTKTESLLEELNEVERRCNDLLGNPVMSDYDYLKERLLKFQELLSYYKIAFQKALVSVLPAIRDGTLENKALAEILDHHYTSAFTASNLNKWLDDITTEMSIVKSYTSVLKDLPVVSSEGSFNSILFDPEVNVLVCLSFTSVTQEDSYLVALEDFINSDGFADQNAIKTFSFQATQPWFISPEIAEIMKQNLSLFTSFSKANKNEMGIKSIIACIPDSNNPGTSIQIYQNGYLQNPKFQPVSKPAVPVVEISGNKILLKFAKSPTGETVKFKVEYRTTPPSDSAADVGAWKVIQTSDAQLSFTLTGLQPAELYWVRYRIVSDVGVSEASDTVSFPFHGRLNIAVSRWTYPLPSLFSNLRDKLMTYVSMSRWSLLSLKSEVTNVTINPSIPFTKSIPGLLKPGMALYFQGIAPTSDSEFSFNLLPGPIEERNFTLHMKCNIYGKVMFNSCINDDWKSEESTSGCPISSGSSFDIFLVPKAEGYEIYINGKKCYLYKHRMPMEKVNTLHIYGNFVVNIIGTVPNWNTSTFGKELLSGTSRTIASNIQADVPNPVSIPKKNFYSKLPAALTPGQVLFFQGVVASDGNRLEINLQTGPNFGYHIALHISCRLDCVVFNSCRNGAWDNEEKVSGSPFVRGGAFDILMAVKQEGFEIYVNGLRFYMFNHRIGVENINSFSITGEAFMNNFAILEVDNINMKAMIPANI